MRQNSKKLINLPVFTETGQEIGHLIDFNIDTESQSVLDYLVRPYYSIAGIFNNQLIINRGQIVDIRKDKIIVSENAVKSPQKRQLISQKEKKAVPVVEKNL